jgi:prophage DNA circulation protein
MDRAKKELSAAFEQLSSFECYLASDSAANMCRENIRLVKTERVELRAAVIKCMGLDPKISEAGEVVQVFDNLAKAEVEMHAHKGTETAKLLRETTKLRGVLETTANMAAVVGMEPAPKRAKREPAASGGAAGDFVDLTQEDD